MSLAHRVLALEEQVRELQIALRALSLRVEGPDAEFDIVSDPGAPSSAASQAQPSQVTLGFSPEPRQPSSSPLGFRASTPPSVASAAVSGAAALTPRSRGAACREIGLFLRRAADGQHRGPSGRERLPGGSRFWVVVKDYTGDTFSPVRVYHRFGDCKDLVKRGTDLGNSVCIGLPSRGDVIAVCAAGGFELPSSW